MLASHLPQGLQEPPPLCRSELASRRQPLDRIAGKPAPTGSTSNTAHSVGASLPRDGNRWSASLASQLPQGLQATPPLCRSELASRRQPLERIAGKPAPTGSASNTAHSAGASLPRDGTRWIASLASQLPQGLQATPRTLQERACLVMAAAGSHRWQASSHRVNCPQKVGHPSNFLGFQHEQVHRAI